MTKQRIYAYVGSIRRFIEEGDRDKATKALETFRDYLLGQTAGTMQEEYEREQKEIINKANSPHSPADLDDDPVNPAHYMSYYKDGIDCITAMKHAFGEEAVQHFCITNAFKYIWRHMSKNGMQDIKKAVWYLNKYLELNK